ncbi:MAG TPA: lysylphosphatidylglycerol synthase domain-containing protein [Actinophytocola sp.]|uniref:lysylphosphatidylglycerol synthase domain-containing protein n=1 Tax=Actinophytocola sp. TaxID=1872138 RepID=UPI002DDD5B0C|nr:lysylphosphatidylglycerol synthase domain-containing protein [Actinophytocola sp.]HEV2781845.1 lysylphosphatidylglycerol synthase domain-containing protein [Actinophytocola sp.]
MTVDADVTTDEAVAAPKPASTRKTTIVTWLRRLLLLVVVAGAAWTLTKHWPTVWATTKTLPWGSVLLSELAVIVGIAFGVLAWRTIVKDIGPPVGYVRCAQINLVGSLGKYVPGSVWAYLLQMELARKAGVGRARIVTGSLVQVGLALVATAGFATAALPSLYGEFPGAIFFAIALPVGVCALHPRILTWAMNRILKLIRRQPLEAPLHFRMIGEALGLQVVSYAFFGLHLWILADAVGAAPGLAGFLLCTAAVTIGLNAGMFVFVLPSGAGIRDGMIVAVLISSLAYPQALAFALVSRVMFVVADLVTAGAAAWLARWRVPIRPAAPREP